MITWSQSIDGIDWHELEALYRAAPLGNKDAAGLQIVYTNSRYCCFAFDGRLVGAGRALAEASTARTCASGRAAEPPGHRRRQADRRHAGELSRGHRKIILYAVAGKEPFYRKFGFRRMLTAMAIFPDMQDAIARGYVAED